MELAQPRARHHRLSLLDFHPRLVDKFTAMVEATDPLLHPEVSPFTDSDIPPDEILQGEDIMAFLAKFDSEARIRFYQQTSTNNHPPPVLYIFNGGRAIQYLTCEASGECWWCIGDGGAHARDCTNRIDDWLDSVYPPTETEFVKQASGGVLMERQDAQRGSYHDEVDSQNGEANEQIYFVSPEDSISVAGINPDWDGDKERWIPVCERKPQQTEILYSEHQVRRPAEKDIIHEISYYDIPKPFPVAVDVPVLSGSLGVPSIIGYIDNWVDNQQIEPRHHIIQASTTAPASTNLDGLPAYGAFKMSSSSSRRSPSVSSVASCISSTMEVACYWENDEAERKPIPRSYLQPIDRKAWG